MIIGHSDKEFIKHPEGDAYGVCVDFIDQGYKETQYGLKPKCRIVFETEAQIVTVDPATQMEIIKPAIASRTFTISMHPDAALRKFLEGWSGKRFTEAQAKAFDTDTLIGKPAYLNIIWEAARDGSDKVYDMIMSCTKMPRDVPPYIASGLYVPMADRPPKTDQPAQKGPAAVAPRPAARPAPLPPRAAAPRASTARPDSRPLAAIAEDEDDGELPF